MSEETKTISAQELEQKWTTSISPLMDKLSSLAETMVNLQTQIDGLKVEEKQVATPVEEKPQVKTPSVSSEEAWESLFK